MLANWTHSIGLFSSFRRLGSQRDGINGPIPAPNMPGALQGDDYPLEYDEKRVPGAPGVSRSPAKASNLESRLEKFQKLMRG